MLEDSLKILKRITDAGYSAYLVGGFVRDYLLGIPSSDVDICTNAKPKELLSIFENAKIPKEDYGSVVVILKNTCYEITTFRKEIKYLDYRRPESIEYIDSLELDVLRRDFTINTLCMDKDKNIIDILNGRKEIEDGIIKCVGDSNQKFSDDALRILRAVRFAAKLNFSLDKDVVQAILKNKHLLRNISYERKKEELDKIFTSNYVDYGISLLLELGLDLELEIPKLKLVKNTSSLIAIWTVLDVLDVYHFSNNEKDLILDVQKALLLDNLDPYTLYKYGLYVNSTAGDIKGISNISITQAYNDLPIHSRGDILIKAPDIMKALNREEGPYLKEIYEDLERAILYSKLLNDKDVLLQYCVDNYS